MNDYVDEPYNLYDSIYPNEYEYIQRPPLQRPQLPLPGIEDRTMYDEVYNDTPLIHDDNTDVKRVIDSEFAEAQKETYFPTNEQTLSKTTRFVHAESLQPTDDDYGPHVLEPQCYPSGNQDVPKDTNELVQWFNNSSDREKFAISITSSVIPHYYKENNMLGLAKLTYCKCNMIQILSLNKLADLLFRHRISSCQGHQLLNCAEVVWGSLRNNRNECYIKHISNLMLILLSTVYLWGISNPEKLNIDNTKAILKKCISGFPEKRVCTGLDESSKNLLSALKCFMHCLEANISRQSSLQIGEWEQTMLLEENRRMIEDNVPSMVYSELIVLSVLLLNLLSRVPDSSLQISSLLKISTTRVLQNTKCKLCHVSLKQRLMGKNNRYYQQCRSHLSSNFVVTALIRSMHTINYNEETHKVMKTIIEMCINASSLTKQMLLTELEKMCFNKQNCVRVYGVELLGVEGKYEKVCRGYIVRNLSLARLSFNDDAGHKSPDVGTPFWMVMLGKFGDKKVTVNCLIPTKHCIIKLFSEDYKNNAERDTTANNWNTFEILKNLQCYGGHSNIVKLLAYQYIPLPLFYVLEHQPNMNYLEWLLNNRKDNTWIRNEALVFMIKDIVSAIRFLHENGIFHRDLTACRCIILDQSHTVKLHQFRLAKKGTVKGNEVRFATRWMAPESMIDQTFSQQSDIWLVGLFIWEVLTHGCWPYTEHSDKLTDMIMELVVYRHLKPAQFPCIPDKLYELILSCLHMDPNSRITLDKLEDELSSIIQAESNLSPRTNGVIIPHGSTKQRRYPNLSEKQKKRCEKKNFEPEKGIPQCIISQRIKVPYVNIGNDRITTKTVLPITERDLISDDHPNIDNIRKGNMVQVTEPVQDEFVIDTYVIKRISGVLKFETKVESNGNKCMKYTYPNGDTLLNLVLSRRYGTNINMYIEILLNVAKVVERFHSQGWIVRCISARDIWVTDDGKTYLLRLGRTVPLLDPNEDWQFGDVFEDRYNWLPLEVIRDKMYSSKSDVYMVAMTAYEMFLALDLHIPKPVRNELGCIPFAIHSKKKIEDILSFDEVLQRPDLCPEWLYSILRKCLYRERIRRPSITELIRQIEKERNIQITNEEPCTSLSTSHDEDSESAPDVPPRIIPQKILFSPFLSTMSFPNLPPPCISSDDDVGILSGFDSSQFRPRNNDSSSNNYPDSSDDTSSERNSNMLLMDNNNMLDKTTSSLTTEPVEMREKRGRNQRCTTDSSVEFDPEKGKHPSEKGQLMNNVSHCTSSENKEKDLRFQNDSDSDTSAGTIPTQESQDTSSTSYLKIYSTTPGITTPLNKDDYFRANVCATPFNENIHKNSPTINLKLPVNNTAYGNVRKRNCTTSTVPKLEFQNSSSSYESNTSDPLANLPISDLSTFYSQNCCRSDRPTYNWETYSQNYCSKCMNSAGDRSSESNNDGYLTAKYQKD